MRLRQGHGIYGSSLKNPLTVGTTAGPSTFGLPIGAAEYLRITNSVRVHCNRGFWELTGHATNCTDPHTLSNSLAIAGVVRGHSVAATVFAKSAVGGHNGGMAAARRSNKRPYGEPHPELEMDRVTGGRRSVTRRGEDWSVQNIRASDKTYRCPGCNQEIAPGVAHIAAWAQDSLFGREAALSARRHWHTRCWQIQE